MERKGWNIAKKSAKFQQIDLGGRKAKRFCHAGSPTAQLGPRSDSALLINGQVHQTDKKNQSKYFEYAPGKVLPFQTLVVSFVRG